MDINRYNFSRGVRWPLLVLGVGALGLSLQLPWWGDSQIGPGLFPGVLAVIVLAGLLLRPVQDPACCAGKPDVRASQLILAALLFPLMLPIGGSALALGLAGGAAARILGLGVGGSLVLALAGSAALHGLVMGALGMELPWQPLGVRP